jgi:hypothetical protein
VRAWLHRINRLLIGVAFGVYCLLTVLNAIRLVAEPRSFRDGLDRGLALSTVIVSSWILGIFTVSALRILAKRRVRQLPPPPPPTPPKLNLMCPRCKTMLPLDEIAAHVDEHIAEGRLMSSHSTSPVTAIVRNPGDTDWRIIQEGV